MTRASIVYKFGVSSYKVYWIKQSKNDIYHGFYFKIKKDFHWSHHKNGKSHIKVDGQYTPPIKRIPISAIKGIYYLHTFYAGDNEWCKKYYKPYNNQKVENIIEVDTDLFPKDISINVHLYLIKPEEKGLLRNFIDSKVEKDKVKCNYTIYRVIKEMNPWLVVYVNGIK